MKTMEQFLAEVKDNKALKAEMKTALESGKEQEFLAAQGVEISAELADEALEDVSGGGDLWRYKNQGVTRRDNRGNPTHWLIRYNDRNVELYFTCPYCGRLLHEGWGSYLYCDPCDDWFIDGNFGSAVPHTIP